MIKLPRLQPGYEKVPGLFQRYWDEAMKNIETSVNQILILPEIQAAIEAANEAAAAANTAAETAQEATTEQAKEASIVGSYIEADSFTPPLLSVTSAGVVTVASHTRKYGNTTLNPSVSITGTSFTASGVASGDVIRVYYDDADRSGGTVTWSHTVDPTPPLAQSGDTHSVGTVVVPGTGTSDGNYINPPGYVPQREEV